MFHRHSVGIQWARQFHHPCFDVEVYGLKEGGEIRVRAARCSVNVRLRAGVHEGERGIGEAGELIYASRPVGSLIFVPTATWVTLCADGGGEYASVRFDPSYLKALAPPDAAAASNDVLPPFLLPELESLMRRMASQICDTTPDAMETLVRSAGVLLGRHMASGGGPDSLCRARLSRVLAYIEAHLSEDMSLGELAAIAGMSVAAFRRHFGSITGLPPHRFIMAARVRRAQALLLGTDMALSQIAHAVGYATQSRFCIVFREVAGVTPSEYRRKQAA